MSSLFKNPKQRKVARICLYGGALAVLAAVVAFWHVLKKPRELDEDQIWTQMDFAAIPEVDMLRRYVRIDTSRDTGSELAGAAFLAGELERLGLEPTIERLGENAANLWAVVEGEEREALVLHNHIDVFPIVDEEKWQHPPFEAYIDGPWLYGRGTFDMKSVAIAQLSAIESLLATGRKPKKSIIFLATGGEEHGSELGAQWIVDQHPELIGRFWVVLTEGGAVEPITHTEIKYWGIETAQDRYAILVFCADEREGLEGLRGELVRIVEERLDLRLTDETQAFLRAYGPTRKATALAEAVTDPWVAIHNPENFRKLRPYLKAAFRDHLTLFPVEEDPEGGYRLRVVFLLLPGTDFEEARRRMTPEWLTHGLTYRLDPPRGASHGSPYGHPVFRELAESVRGVYPEAPVGPLFLAGTATDARFFRETGILSYGFSPFPIFNVDTFRKDGRNERIGLRGYVNGLEIYRDAVRRLAG